MDHQRKVSTKKHLKQTIVGMAALGIGVVILLMVLIVLKIIKDAPSAVDINIRKRGSYSSMVYDDQGNNIDRFNESENREYAYLDTIPKKLQEAVIVSEDENFYKHRGIDLSRIANAFISNISEGGLSHGGTTITGQLVKQNYSFDQVNPIDRKIQESYIAIELEKLYSKQELLEFYLNSIELGQGIKGVQAAANRYFGKNVVDLNVTESAVLAAIIERPSYYDPIVHPENNWQAVEKIIGRMVHLGYMTETEKREALAYSPYEQTRAVHQEKAEKSVHSYFVNEVYSQVLRDLQKRLRISELEAKGMIYSGGLKIYTTLNESMQSIVDKYMSNETYYPKTLQKVSVDYGVNGKKPDGTAIDEYVGGRVLNSRTEVEAFKAEKKKEWHITDHDTIEDEYLIINDEPQAAFVLADYHTGQVKALYGGRGTKMNLSFNYATQAIRQPGETLSVLADYAPAFELGYFTPESELVDEAIQYKLSNGSTYTPENGEAGYTNKPMSLKEALARSNNVIATRLLSERVGVGEAYDYLKAFGFELLSENDKTLEMAHGRLANGVTAMELNSAYGTIANGGVYKEPVFYTKVVDNKGEVILDTCGENAEGGYSDEMRQVIKKETAQSITKMLTYAVDEGTGKPIKSYIPNMPVAGKTGTSNDRLFVGYTPYYAATIWTGYSQLEPLRSDENYELRLWGEIMNEIHQGLPSESFK